MDPDDENDFIIRLAKIVAVAFATVFVAAATCTAIVNTDDDPPPMCGRYQIVVDGQFGPTCVDEK